MILLLNISNIVVKYYDVEHEPGDNHVQRYNDYKMTIHLTDELVGVLNAKMLGGKKGDILLYAPDEIHFGRFLTSGLYRYIHFLIPIDFCDKLSCLYPSLKKVFDSKNSKRLNCIRGIGKYKDKIIEISEDMVEHLKKDQVEDFNIITSIMQILLICAQLYDKQSDNDTAEFFTPYTHFAMKYMNEHYSEKITIGEIAEKAGCSTTYLSKIFKKDTGKSVYTYLTEYRISKSTMLLKEGLNVTETCYAVEIDTANTEFHGTRRRPTAEDYKWALETLEKEDAGIIDRRYANQWKRMYEEPLADPDLEVQACSIKFSEPMRNGVIPGDVAICSMPGEIFVEFGLELKEKSPFAHTMICELANGYYGYISTKQAIESGGYETWINMSTNMDKETGSQLVENQLKLLNYLKK